MEFFLFGHSSFGAIQHTNRDLFLENCSNTDQFVHCSTTDLWKDRFSQASDFSWDDYMKWASYRGRILFFGKRTLKKNVFVKKMFLKNIRMWNLRLHEGRHSHNRCIVIFVIIIYFLLKRHPLNNPMNKYEHNKQFMSQLKIVQSFDLKTQNKKSPLTMTLKNLHVRLTLRSLAP